MFRLMFCHICFFFWVGVTLTVSPEDDRQFQIHPLGFADGEVIAEAARSIVKDRGKVMYDRGTHRLVVEAPEAEQKKIEALLNQMNVSPEEIRFDIQAKGAGTDRIHRLVVLSGRESEVIIETSVPHREWLLSYARRHRLIQKEVSFESVKVGFQMTARLLPNDHVKIQLVPMLKGFEAGSLHTIRFANVMLEAIVKSGEVFTLSSNHVHQSFYSKFLVGTNERGEERPLVVTFSPLISGG